jgi:hypothetical protein
VVVLQRLRRLYERLDRRDFFFKRRSMINLRALRSLAPCSRRTVATRGDDGASGGPDRRDRTHPPAGPDIGRDRPFGQTGETRTSDWMDVRSGARGRRDRNVIERQRAAEAPSPARNSARDALCEPAAGSGAKAGWFPSSVASRSQPACPQSCSRRLKPRGPLVQGPPAMVRGLVSGDAVGEVHRDR